MTQRHPAPTGRGSAPSRIAVRLDSAGAARPGSWLTAAGLTLAGLVLAAWLAHAAAERALARILENGLRTALAANVVALDLWLDRERDAAAGLLRDPELAAAALSLVRAGLAQEPVKSLRARPEAGRLTGELGAFAEQDGAAGYLLLDVVGRVVAASSPDALGARVGAEVLELLGQAMRDGSLVSRPLRLALDGQDTAGLRLLAMAPVRDATGTSQGALAVLLNAAGDFSRVVGTARIGARGTSYAFDRQGRLLSALEPDEAEVPDQDIRDPGTGDRLGLPAAVLSLTRMAASAVEGGSGVDVEGYRDFRGVEVVGAWQWLDRWRFGIATEVPEAEARAPLRPLTHLLWVLGALAALVPVLGVPAAFFLSRLRQRMAAMERLGQYRLLRELGSGGMGVVYEVEHVLLQRRAALKMLRPEAMSDEAVARFEREVRLTARLCHPSAITVFDFGRSENGQFYYVMEYLDGLDLATLIERDGTMPPARVVHVLRHVCAALREAHALGLVHRDIKPANIMLCARGGEFDVVKLLDFGLVRDLGDAAAARLTMPTLLSGTPAYIAPERLRDPLAGDRRVDIYALGAVAYILLTGRDLFQGTSSADIVLKAATEAAAAPSARATQPIPPELDALVLACLAKDPGDRPRDVEAMLAVLGSLASAHTWTCEDAGRWWRERMGRGEDTGLAAA